ncbi:MAG TPA: MFS transporter [Ktedonobacterales bacterium]
MAVIGAADGEAKSEQRTPRSRGSTFSALRIYNYRVYWLGQLVSVTGTFMQTTAQQWLVLSLSQNNPLAVGLVGTFQFGPLLLLAPFTGVIGDRLPRRKLLMATQSISGVLALALWTLTALHVVQLWHVYGLALLLGIVNAVDMPVRQAFVSDMVPGDSILNAVSLNSAQFNVSRILGPTIAGILIAAFGIPNLFLINALSYVAVVGGLFMMHPNELFSIRAAGGRTGSLRAMSEGMRFIWRTPKLAVLLLMVAVVGTFGFNFNVLLPLQAKSVLHANSVVFGMLTSSLGIGALIGALLAARRRGMPKTQTIIISAVIFGVAQALVVFAHPDLMYQLGLSTTHSNVVAVALSILLIAVLGSGMSSFSTSANSRTQLSTPPEMRGRVMSIYMMLFAGTTPIGNLAISASAAAWGVPAAWVVAGVPCLLVAGLAMWLWRLQSPAKAGETVSAAA